LPNGLVLPELFGGVEEKIHWRPYLGQFHPYLKPPMWHWNIFFTITDHQKINVAVRPVVTSSMRTEQDYLVRMVFPDKDFFGSFEDTSEGQTLRACQKSPPPVFDHTPEDRNVQATGRQRALGLRPHDSRRRRGPGGTGAASVRRRSRLLAQIR
jgi:hypothetical protein